MKWGTLAVIALACITLWSADANAQCQSNADCKGGRVCDSWSKACIDRPPASTACTKDTDCPAGAVCNGGTCATAVTQPQPPPGPPVAPPPGPPRMRNTGKTKGINGLIIAGAVVWGGIWLLGIPVTIALDATGGNGIEPISGYMAIPLVGPWIALGADDSAASGVDDFAPALVVSGVLQSAGAIMLVLGLAIRTPVQAPAYGLLEGVEQKVDVAVHPMAVGDGVGVGVTVGAF